MSKYIAVYEALFPSDQISEDDPRRGAIIAEMRAVHLANTTAEARQVVEWWPWESQAQCTRWVNRARKMMAAK